MKTAGSLFTLILGGSIFAAQAQVAVTPNPDHEVMLQTKVRKPSPIEARVKAPLVAMMADGDLVVLAFAREYPEPQDPSKKYTTTWFDMFRIMDGKIAEHWDPAVK